MNVMIIFCIFLFAVSTFAWENEDFALFDLIEEINFNFYELLGINQSATASDIKRSYRKLSLQLHPDRNKQPDAEIKFRHLVAVYETLKDEALRAKYDDVLVNGLPDWRQPIYYYRRVRKMGLLEISVALLILLTTGHFITMWAIYMEKKFELQEIFQSKRKKERKLKRVKTDPSVNEDLELLMLEELGEKPKLSQLLPILVFNFFVHHVVMLPSYISKVFAELRTIKFQPKPDDPDVDEKYQERERSKKQKYSFIDGLPVLEKSQDSENAHARNTNFSDKNEDKEIRKGEWSEDELDNLVKGVIRFPGGTPERWEKISQFVGRSVKEVLKMANELKNSNPIKSKTPIFTTSDSESLSTISQKTVDNFNNDNESSDNLSSSSKDLSISKNFIDDITRKSSMIAKDQVKYTEDTPLNSLKKNKSKVTNPANSKNDEIQEHSTEHSGKKTVRFEEVKKDASADVDAWSRLQQKQLEAALVAVAKEHPNRWEAIASLVEGKNKEDCILRYKYLSDIVRNKKQK